MLFPRSPAVRINVEGARIVEDDDTPQTGRDIQFPYHDSAISHIAVDIGGTLAKCVYFKRDQDSGVRLNFTRFETANIAELITFLGTLIEKRRQSKSVNAAQENICIMATGGGAYKFYERIKAELGVEVHKEDEMECLIVGLDFFINEIPGEVFTYGGEEEPMRLSTDKIEYPYLLVNIGSGVSMIKVSGPNKHERIGGSSLGGGTLCGILSLITGATSFDEMLELASHGDNAKVDMLVGDIYGQGYGKIGLKSSTIASTFGKVSSLQRQKGSQARNMQDGPDQQHDPQDAEMSESRRASSSGYKTPESMDMSGTFRPHDKTNGHTHADHPTNTTVDRTTPHTTSVHHDALEASLPAMSSLSLMSDSPDSAFAAADAARSWLYAISNNIAQIAYLQAQRHGIGHIYFGGSYIRGHAQTMLTLSYAIKFWSGDTKVAYFLRHEGYLGAIGAFLLHQPKWATTWSRRSSAENGETLNRAELKKSALQNGGTRRGTHDGVIVP